MIVNYKFEMQSEDETFKSCSAGTDEIDIDKITKVKKQVFEFGYTLKDFVMFFLENIDEKSIEDLLFAMDRYIERTDE